MAFQSTVTSGSVTDITAAQYNALQTVVSNILGTGSGNTGYGQTVTSAQVTSVTDIIDHSHLNNLKTDLDDITYHQVNDLAKGMQQTSGVAASNLTQVNTGNIITAGNLSVEDNSTNTFNDYQQAVDNIDGDARFTLSAAQATQATLTNGTKTHTTDWKGNLSTEVTLTWESADYRRYFFNAGGSISIVSALAGGSNAAASTKYSNWISQLDETITFFHNRTESSATNGSPEAARGNYQLTTAYQQIYDRAGPAGSNYSMNKYVISAKAPGATQIVFKIEWNDLDQASGYEVDEYVFSNSTSPATGGSLTLTIGETRATGSYVNTAGPSCNINNIS